MTWIEVILIIAGFACICISFFVSRKKGLETGSGLTDSRSSDVWSDRDEEVIRQHIDEMLQDRQAYMLDEARDEMNRICNEKIMAVDEFSGQVLEKIESNHKEVVFMYNMLNEKDKDIKKLMSEPVKTGLEHVQNSREQETKQPDKKKPERTSRTTQKVSGNANARKETKHTAAGKKEGPKAQPGAKRTPASRQYVERPADSGSVQRANVPGNVNLQIQKMYKEGKSVLEISKELNIGQGEVKLVIALYGGTRK